MFRTRPISFGNPALGVYHGTVYTVQTRESHSIVVEGAIDAHCLVAMVDVPPEQVPEGILNLVRAHRPWIHHVRIVIGEEPESSSLGERTYLVLIELSNESATQLLVDDLHQQPYTSLDETQTCSIQHVIALQGNDGVSLMSPFFAPKPKTSSGQIQQPYEAYHCPVCLEHMDLEIQASGETVPILTTVCNHSFHMDCLVQWQDSPCPVCRYDHSGLNEALSQCETCGTTEHNFVCLICGRVSCDDFVVPPVAAAAASQSDMCSPTSTLPPTSTAPATTSHARQHYNDTLHAYALDTQSQHVWDFAGQGYVHRLLQNKDDGKLVEVGDPNNTTSAERSEHPGLSQAQEGELVHRKLEGFASQYYTLLKSQLEQQRIFYESRLEELKRECSTKPRQSGGDLLAALKQEQHQLSQRLNTLEAKGRKAQDDVNFLRNMNESLEANQAPLQQQIQTAEQERLEARQMFQKLLPPLQEKVTRLMLQLESEGAEKSLARLP